MKSPAPQHRDDIQGLRAVAVLLVVFNHAGVTFLSGGFVGVDVFFVVSGFLITGLLLRHYHEQGRVGFLDFYARRARRILPMAALVLVVTDIAAVVFLNYVRARTAVEDSIWASLFAANFRFESIRTDYFASAQPASPIQHFWSLAVEEQFYLVWPALLALLLAAGVYMRRRFSRPEAGSLVLAALLAVVAISAVWAVARTAKAPVDAYFSPLTRAWQLGAGAAIAVAGGAVARVPQVLRSTMSWLGLIGIVLAGVWFNSSTPFPGLAALLPVGATVLVIVAGSGPTRWGASTALGLRPMTFIGDVSYSFYLWHWPFLIIAGGMTLSPLNLVTKLALVGAAFVASALSYTFYENPLRRGEWLSAWRGQAALLQWPASILAVGAVSVLILNVVIAPQLRAQQLTASAAGTIPADAAAVQAAVAAANVNAPLPTDLSPSIGDLTRDVFPLPFGCAPQPTESQGKICILGDANSQHLMVVFGDSHAFMWLSPLDRIAQMHALKLIPFVKDSCHDAAWITGDTPCSEWYQWALTHIADIHPDMVVFSHCSTDCGVSDWTGFRETVRVLHTITSRVIVLGDPPGSDVQPADCLLSHGATMRTCTYPIPAAKTTIMNSARTAALGAHADFVDVLPWFCYRGRCPTVVGHVIAWSDKGHISSTYALALESALDHELELTGPSQ